MRIESKWTSDIIGDYETLFLEMPLSQCEVREQHIFHYILHFQHFFTEQSDGLKDDDLETETDHGLTTDRMNPDSTGKGGKFNFPPLATENSSG